MRPVMRPGAGLHTAQAWGKPRAKRAHLVPPQLPPQDNGTFRIDTVTLDYGLGGIDANRGNLRHGSLPSGATLTAPNVADCDARSGNHPLRQRRATARSWRSRDELVPCCFLPFLRKDRTIKPWDHTSGQQNLHAPRRKAASASTLPHFQLTLHLRK
jgi:hypothetical protein